MQILGALPDRASQLCGQPVVLSGNYGLGISAAVSKGFLL